MVLTPQNVVACLIPLSIRDTMFSKPAAELQKYHLYSPHSLPWAAIWYLLCLCSSWQDAEAKKNPPKQKTKTSRYLCLAWIYEEVRKCIFNVYEFLPWPCEATAVLVHKQHDEVSYYQTERPQLHAGGCFCLSFHVSSRNLSAKLPHAMCYAYLWFIDDNHGASHL